MSKQVACWVGPGRRVHSLSSCAWSVGGYESSLGECCEAAALLKAVLSNLMESAAQDNQLCAAWRESKGRRHIQDFDRKHQRIAICEVRQWTSKTRSVPR